MLVWNPVTMRFDTRFDPILEFYNRSNEAETVQTQALLAQLGLTNFEGVFELFCANIFV